MDNRIIIREYLEGLKEDQELDAIFPLLLMAKGFRLLATPARAKGQSQYGKDVVAIGKEGDTVFRFYFELKGGADRHIDQQTYFSNDGIRMSLLEAKDTPFRDVGVPAFDKLPVKYVLVHNGEIKENIRQTFDGFIAQTFPNGNFERWDLNWLTEQFDLFLFNEHLIPNQADSRLFRRVLLLIDTPDYNLSDFKELVINLLGRMPMPDQKRQFKSAWATLVLLAQIVWHKCRQNNNLYPAKDALTFLLLSAWAWVLRNKLETKTRILKEFRRLVRLHFEFLREYIQKTAEIAALPEGLFSEGGGPFEAIGYPLRSFEYLGTLAYYFEASHYYPNFDKSVDSSRKAHLEHWHKSYLTKLVKANTACHRPILDAHSIPILATILYVIKSEEFTANDRKFLNDFLFKNLESIIVIKRVADRFPSLSLHLDPLVEFVATGSRPFNYSDSSSLLLPMLLEMIAHLKSEAVWNMIQPAIKEYDIDMQAAYPLVKEYDIEQLLFEQHLDEEFFVETSLEFPQTIEEYTEVIKEKYEQPIVYRTDLAGFPFLRTLAHLYYHSEFFPADWRSIMVEEGMLPSTLQTGQPLAS
ncbi:hypothetical protein IC229_29835 [Spirosoma sp. BT702]|uniref:Uncharacterized protein n=1 Tax=Spirosoma profusum TaxID=2771354 RepID=A0A927AUX0_9BACT|nr:hypothetical protein [Spirosoma profusum]MBD2704870.1 hypothetical protein [Spirosoma profusum]